MEDAAQAAAYAAADFSEPHEAFVAAFRAKFPEHAPRHALDLGCGPGDVTWRFAREYPGAEVVGVDGSAAMIEAGRELVARSGVRLTMVCGYLPGAMLPRSSFDTLISNSLLHHLRDPATLWRAIRAHAEPGAAVFVMDLSRPATREDAARIVDTYAAGEAEVLRTDFFCSLLAAYRPEEVRAQLAAEGLSGLAVETTSDRHFIVYGRR